MNDCFAGYDANSASDLFRIVELSKAVERELLRLIARGYLYKEIARRLVD